MKQIFYILIASLGILTSACERDMNKDFDMKSPTAVIETDTLEVVRGESVVLKATVKDPSGISNVSLSYPNWEIDNEIKFDEGAYPSEYSCAFDVKVPEDALFEWEEEVIKNDGTRFTVTKRHHKISLICFDGVRNKNIFNFYIKVK